MCSLSPPRSFDGSSPNLVGVSRWTSELPLRGSFSKRSTGRRVKGSLSLSTILYRDQPHTTQLQRRLLLGKQQSLNRRLLLWCMSTTYVGGPGNCYWGVLFLKRQRATGQTGQRLTFTFTILYMIADDASLTPPRCKKHTASFARSTGKFPSLLYCGTNTALNVDIYVLMMATQEHNLSVVYCDMQYSQEIYNVKILARTSAASSRNLKNAITKLRPHASEYRCILMM